MKKAVYPHSVKLTTKQKKFVHEYLIDLNATQAAIRAGYSKRSAGYLAYETLQKPYIQAYLKIETEKLFASADIKAWMVISELKKIAFSKITDYIEIDDQKNIKVKDIAVNPEAIQSVSISKTMTKSKDGASVTTNNKVSLWDKPGSLRDLGRYLGIFVDKVENSGDPNKPVVPVLNLIMTTSPEQPK